MVGRCVSFWEGLFAPRIRSHDRHLHISTLLAGRSVAGIKTSGARHGHCLVDPQSPRKDEAEAGNWKLNEIIKKS